MAALIATMAVGAIASSSAVAAPSGGFSVFADCPVTVAQGCIYARTESGEFVIGKEKVPITKTITLQGGFTENEAEEETFVAAKDGNTLSKTPQKVPGGLAGLIKCDEITGSGLLEIAERASCELAFENGATGVNATTELAAPASSIGLNEGNLLTEKGTALSLPIKVHLENPLLGSSCYIGSNSSPIVINFTTGTTSPPAPNKPIKGSKGKAEETEEGLLLIIRNNSLVENAFSAPGVTGCGGVLSFLLDPIIDSKLELPSAAGHNTAILDGTLEQASAEVVQNHE